MLKTLLTDMSGRRAGHSLQHTKRTDRIMEQPKAVQIFFGKGGSTRRDTLSISDAASVSLQVTRQYVPKVLETKAYSVIIV